MIACLLDYHDLRQMCGISEIFLQQLQRFECHKRHLRSVKWCHRCKCAVYFWCCYRMRFWDQWRRQLVGAWARAPPPWRLREFFSLGYTLKQVVWFDLVLCQTLNSALFVQPYSLLNDAITGYNGACAKVVFTARRHALARSLLSAGVRPSVCPPRSCAVLYPDGWRYHQTSFSAR